MAGAVATGMVLTSVVSFAEGTRAGPHAVFALLMSAAWFSWYRLGRVEKKWSLAWPVSLAFVLVGVFGVGLQALVVFYFPLLFLRRPLRLWPRVQVTSHVLSLAACALVITLWLWVAPKQVLFPWTVFALRSIPEHTGSYLLRLAFFPVRCAAYLFPWAFFCWPAFCVAFRPVERTPVFCRFCRTLVYPLFLAAWALPGVSPKVLLPLLGPLSVLTGVHFEILVRRHDRLVRGVERFLLGACLVVGSACLFVGSLHGLGVLVLGSVGLFVWAAAMGILLLVVLLARRFDRVMGGRPFWLRVLVLTALLWVQFTAVHGPLQAAWGGERRAAAERLVAGVPPDTTVYRAVPQLLLSECFHLGRPVREVHEGGHLPARERERTAYVLGGERPPVLDIDDRVWQPCGQAVTVRTRRGLRLGPGGEGALLCVDFAPVTRAGARPPAVVRMYRGCLRPASERPTAPVPDGGGVGAGGREAEAGEAVPQADH